MTSIQGWVQQPSLEDFENLLSSQESLAKQMANVSIKEGEGSALMARQKFVKNKGNRNSSTSCPYDQSNSSPSGVHGESSKTTSNKKIFKCYRCGKTRHINRFCQVKLRESNVADKIEEEEDWGKCFVAETKFVDALASMNFEDDWIVDSSCGHHLTGDQSKFSSLQEYNGNEAIVTVDNTVHQVENEGTIIINGKQEDSITLNSVSHVPSMKKNLFSVANAVDAGNFVLFGPRDVKFLRNIKELKADVVHTGKRVKNLFVLSASDSYIEKMSNNDNSHLWHARLGHLNMDKLKAMVKLKLVNGLPNISSFGEG